MRTRQTSIAVALLALACASGAVQAQSKVAKRNDARVSVPVLNKDGKLEAVLLLEPATTGAGAGARWRFGSTTLEATYGLETGSSLALLCDRQNGLSSTMGQLASNCVLGVLGSAEGDKPGTGSRHATSSASLSRNGNKVGVAVGSGRDTLPVWLAPNQSGGAR